LLQDPYAEKKGPLRLLILVLLLMLALAGLILLKMG
jgi:flagellar basal body-associated protein FliL